MNPTARAIRWGILGTGKIAHAFVEDLKLLPDALVSAVGSRTAEGAARFADTHRIPQRYGSYAQLVHDPALDVIYVASPHIAHREHMLLCLEAGKAVLCEKPLTMNAAQAREVIHTARAEKLFVMEAMWTRFIPLIVRLRELVAHEVIGELEMLIAGMGKVAARESGHYLFDLQNGGGLVLDATVYPISLGSLFFGTPRHISGVAQFDDGVDVQEALALGYARGEVASISTSLVTDIPPAFSLHGTKGRIHVHPPLFAPTRMTVVRAGHAHEEIEIPFEGNGMHYEAAHVMGCLQSGKEESTVMPLDESLAIMETLDCLRAQWNFRYPFEM